MCLILFSYRQHAEFPFILAANRDEFLDRPATAASFWESHPNLLAGRDIRAGGTWMGVTRDMRFAAITNYRDPASMKENAPSRGHLVLDYLAGSEAPEAYLSQLKPASKAFNGYNLLAGNTHELWYYSNVENSVRQLGPGLYGLSNHLLDTPWPKVKKGKSRLQAIIEQASFSPEELLDFLSDTTLAPDEQLPQTGVSVEWERKLSAICIQTPDYATRVSTVIMVDSAQNLTFIERTLGHGNESPGQAYYTIKV